MEFQGGGLFRRIKVDLGRRPDLTVDSLLKQLKREFGKEFEIYPTKLLGADIIIKKSAWTGLAIKLKKDAQGNANLGFNPLMPSAGARILATGLIPILILWKRSWKPLIERFKDFLRTKLVSQVFE